MKRRCEDPLISQTLGFDTYRMGNCIKTDNESKYKIEELTKGKIFLLFYLPFTELRKLKNEFSDGNSQGIDQNLVDFRMILKALQIQLFKIKIHPSA